MVERLRDNSLETLSGADLNRFDLWQRAQTDRPVFRRVKSNLSDREGVPAHAPSEIEWSIIRKYFHAELLYVGDHLAVTSARLLAHAVFYRIKARVPFSVFPKYFGDPHDIALAVRKFVFHGSWDAMIAELSEASPTTLEDADVKVFVRYHRSKQDRYGHRAVSNGVPKHAPNDELWSMTEHLVPYEMLKRGGAGREPRRFLHGVLWLLAEGVSERALPGYFGDRGEFRLALRRFVRHRYYDKLVVVLQHFHADLCADWDFARWASLARSDAPDVGFRTRRAST
jgi:hypothetical protein